jgi:hypothetical protein
MVRASFASSGWDDMVSFGRCHSDADPAQHNDPATVGYGTLNDLTEGPAEIPQNAGAASTLFVADGGADCSSPVRQARRVTTKDM